MVAAPGPQKLITLIGGIDEIKEILHVKPMIGMHHNVPANVLSALAFQVPCLIAIALPIPPIVSPMLYLVSEGIKPNPNIPL
jgi:hypothetical protein